MAERRIYAAYDDEGIYVYQAFRPSIAKAALEQGTFGGGGFNLERMSWIKPSFGWMLYRAGYGLKTDQECILKIKLRHEGFQQALHWAVESAWNPSLFDSEDDWRQALEHSPVRLQWDPDRDLEGRKLERRAIQIGLRGRAINAYVNEWIIGLEEVTGLAHSIKEAKDNRRELPQVPAERIYPVVDELVKSLGISPGVPHK
jgi:hypothetical protein